MENRNTPRIVEAIAQAQNVASFNIKDAVTVSTFDTFVPAIFSGVSGFIAGVTAGSFMLENQSAGIAAGCVLAYASYNGFYFLDRFLSSPRYRADYWDTEPEEQEHPDSFIRTARDKERKRLDGRMRTLLKTFATYYPGLNTMAIGAWYQSKQLNRKQIENVRDYMVLIGAAVKDESGVVSLTEWGRAQLPKWEAGDFGDVIELVNSPLPPNAASSPAQE